MLKSKLRKKLLEKRKKKYHENLYLKNRKTLIEIISKSKIIGAYYPVNFEMNLLNFLKELVSEPPTSNNNNRHLVKPDDHQVGDTNDSSNQTHGNTHSTQSHDHSGSSDMSNTQTGNYTDHHPTTDNLTYGQ